MIWCRNLHRGKDLVRSGFLQASCKVTKKQLFKAPSIVFATDRSTTISIHVCSVMYESAALFIGVRFWERLP